LTHGAYSQFRDPDELLDDDKELDESELNELLDEEDEYFAGIAPKDTSAATVSVGVPDIPTTEISAPLPTTGFTGE